MSSYRFHISHIAFLFNRVANQKPGIHPAHYTRPFYVNGGPPDFDAYLIKFLNNTRKHQTTRVIAVASTASNTQCTVEGIDVLQLKCGSHPLRLEIQPTIANVATSDDSAAAIEPIRARIGAAISPFPALINADMPSAPGSATNSAGTSVDWLLISPPAIDSAKKIDTRTAISRPIAPPSWPSGRSSNCTLATIRRGRFAASESCRAYKRARLSASLVL